MFGISILLSMTECLDSVGDKSISKTHHPSCQLIKISIGNNTVRKTDFPAGVACVRPWGPPLEVYKGG